MAGKMRSRGDNPYVDADQQWPVTVDREGGFGVDDLPMSSSVRDTDRVAFLFHKNAVSCIDKVTRARRWILGPDPEIKSSVYWGAGNSGYLYVGSVILGINLESGETYSTKFPERERPLRACGNIILTHSADKAIRCWDARSEEFLWGYDEEFAMHNASRCGEGVVILQDLEGMHGLEKDTGRVLWRFQNLPWLEASYGELLEERRGRPGGVAPSEAREGPPSILGPVSNGTLIVSYDFGLVAAFDVLTGAPVWEQLLTSPVTGEPLRHARNIAVGGGRVYLNDRQGQGRFSTLHCLNAKTGAVEFQLEEPFTASGCDGALMLGRYFVGGSGHDIAAFDVESRVYVWQYHHKEAPIFGSDPVPVPGGFLFASGKTQELYWFQSAATAEETRQ